jgi:high affinity Mn2+ porin
LSSNGRTQETTDMTLFAGMRLARNTELWVNSEIDQGFGLDDTLGMAGFPSGGAYKVGADAPYIRVPRLFVRHVIALGGSQDKVEAAANQLGGTVAADNITLMIGKFAVVDVFDTNTYAHDPRADFLNWAVIDAGAFDYAADSWGYTNGASVEWNQSGWTLREDHQYRFHEIFAGARRRTAAPMARPPWQDQIAGVCQPRPDGKLCRCDCIGACERTGAGCIAGAA